MDFTYPSDPPTPLVFRNAVLSREKKMRSFACPDAKKKRVICAYKPPASTTPPKPIHTHTHTHKHTDAKPLTTTHPPTNPLWIP